MLGTSISPIHTPARVGDIPRSLADCRKAEKTFKYKGRIGVEEGLSRTVAWYRARRDAR
ncbi:hypothetical protein HY256_06245 [Candidatus Sumerlaeota bacterium]|nr:hypothetical protein [Candidatus Sumerlaeota bacterium]